MRKKAARQKIKFGEKGLRQVEYLGDLPVATGPYITHKTYRFSAVRLVKKVDVRDLPGLARDLGRENLRAIDDEALFEEPEPEIEPEEVEEPEPEPVEIEEVDDGDEYEH